MTRRQSKRTQRALERELFGPKPKPLRRFQLRAVKPVETLATWQKPGDCEFCGNCCHPAYPEDQWACPNCDTAYTYTDNWTCSYCIPRGIPMMEKHNESKTEK